MTTEATNPHITEVRSIMLEQLRALRNANKATLEDELARSKGISELGQTMINSAKVEIHYLEVTNQQQSKFLELPPDIHTGTLPKQTPGVIRNDADKIKVTRKNWVGMVEE
jgi:hypothetical protein